MCDQLRKANEALRAALAEAERDRDMHREAYEREVLAWTRLLSRSRRVIHTLQDGADDGRRDDAIIALADTLLEIARVDGERVEDCARRLDAESPRHPDQFSITARRMKFLALDGAAKAQLAAAALRAHTEAVTLARMAHHQRRRSG